MNEYRNIIGIVITFTNIGTLALLAYNFYRCYVRAIDIDKVKGKNDLDFYFMQMFITMVFFFANSMALYTGYMAYIVNPRLVLTDIINFRLADRLGMFLVAITMNWCRKKHNPFNDI